MLNFENSGVWKAADKVGPSLSSGLPDQLLEGLEWREEETVPAGGREARSSRLEKVWGWASQARPLGQRQVAGACGSGHLSPASPQGVGRPL